MLRGRYTVKGKVCVPEMWKLGVKFEATQRNELQAQFFIGSQVSEEYDLGKLNLILNSYN